MLDCIVAGDGNVDLLIEGVTELDMVKPRRYL